MSSFITNTETKDLKTRLTQLIAKSEELKFLVGFFYFSGLKELYLALKQNQNFILKVLVGLDVDQSNQGLIEVSNKKTLNEIERIENLFSSLKKSINSDEFDKPDFYEQVKFFLGLIKNGRLIIRKTYLPNHSKLFIFKLSKDQVGRKTLFITGSSNLTKAGLSEQSEFNVEISDYGFEEAEKYFDTLWNNAVIINENEDNKKRLIELIENQTHVKEITPFEAYCIVIKNYLDSYEQKGSSSSVEDILINSGYKPYKYQIDAILQALSIIDKHNGVVIADVVGLGKTVIACAVAKKLKRRGVIICPPTLIGDPKVKGSGWSMYKEQFKLYDWEVWSLGELEKLNEYIKKTEDIEIVIVDEAHRFRNEDTQGYELLRNICRNKIVILLTATPFNNKPSDILSLLKLFIIPKKSTISLEENILYKFSNFKRTFDHLSYIKKHYNSSQTDKKKKALNYYKSLFGEDSLDLKKVKKRANYLSIQIRNVIEPVIIRRNRLDLLKNPHYKNEVNELSKVADPLEWFYDLTKEQSKFYDEILKTYFADPEEGGKFTGAIYRPFDYEKFRDYDKLTKEENREFIQQRNLFDIMRRLLVKRFESSFDAFKQSIENFRRVTNVVLTFINKNNKFILNRNLIEKIYELDSEQIKQSLFEYEENLKKEILPRKDKVYDINKFSKKEQFLADIQSDIKMFDEILTKLNNMKLIENDPKFERLIEKINEILEQNNNLIKRKIIIFSEYVDTVNYLSEKFQNYVHIKDKILVVAGDLTKTKETEILENFDASYPNQKDDYYILLTSDKLSEGFNLNRAGIVINYDIPWNPVRVIQRVGRINRISKKVFNELLIANFFPTEQGAEYVKSREIASNKMFLIHNTLGEDSKIFDIDEEPSPAGLYNKIQQNPETLEEESFYTKVLNDYEEISKNYPEIISKLKHYPNRIKVAKKFDEDELLVIIKKDRIYVNVVKYNENNNSTITTSLEDIYEHIKCTPYEKPLNWNTERFWDAYEKIKQFKENIHVPVSEISFEQQALNAVKTLLKSDNEKLLPYKSFLESIKEDIIDYGTLSDFTLRRIANLSTDENKIDETITILDYLINELGENYLEYEKKRLVNMKKEIIIAIENKSEQ